MGLGRTVDFEGTDVVAGAGLFQCTEEGGGIGRRIYDVQQNLEY